MECIRVSANLDQINACRKRIDQVKDQINDVSGALSLGGNNKRLSILLLLHEQKLLCVCDLSDILDITIPAVSQHLRKLTDGHLIKFQKIGRAVFYSLTKYGDELMHPFIELIFNKYVVSENEQ